MWILSFLPDWIFYAMLFVGIVGFSITYLLKFIPVPAIYIYKTPIQLISLLLIIIGVYMSGAISNEESWQAKVTELKQKVAEAEVKSSQENVKIVEKMITKTQVVKVKGDQVVKYIDREIVKYDTKFATGGQCELPKEFYKALNDAAEAPEWLKK
jgi:hypothetical protein